jgi:hypothetical protein
MSPWLRKLLLTSHVVCSVGWLGAVAVFLALAVLGATSSEPFVVRAVSIAMDRSGWFVIAPLCLASLLTGVVQALGTPWGLLRHYWVSIKLVITVLATAVLLVHMRPISRLAQLAAIGPLGDGTRETQLQLIADAAMALLALLVATTLSVYKPRGVTAFGRRAQ